MSGVLAKHIAKLTVSLLVLATIGASAFVQSLHADSLRKDAIALRVLASRRDVGGPDYALLPDRARRWLAEAYADIEGRHAAARTSIQEFLELSPVTTATTKLVDAGGNFCPGQASPGALGVPAGRIRETGSPLLTTIPNVFATTLAGVFCTPATGNTLIDALTDLPGARGRQHPGDGVGAALLSGREALDDPASPGRRTGAVAGCAPAISS